MFPHQVQRNLDVSSSDEHLSTSVPSPLSTIRVEKNDTSVFEQYVSKYSVSSCILSSTSDIPKWILQLLNNKVTKDVHVFDSSTPIPIINKYHTPSTLGTDRIASAIGGYYLAGKNKPVLCIDCGTAITYDFVNAQGEYLGGNISPGLEMRFKSLHDYTSRLPLVDKDGNTPNIGFNTTTAIRSGVKLGIKKEILGYINEYQEKYSDIFIFFTGGDILDFDYPSKKCILQIKTWYCKV